MKLNISVTTDGTPGGQAVVRGADIGHRHRISGPHDSGWVLVNETMSHMNEAFQST